MIGALTSEWFGELPVTMTVDVVVVGDGPAGAVTARSLVQAGASVLMIGRSRRRQAVVGEGLPPAANPVLRILGLWDAFCADGHLPSYGNRSLWASAMARDTDFIRSLDGHGWHLDRARFDAMLVHAARDAGAQHHPHCRLLDLHRIAGTGWRLTVRMDGTHEEIQTAFLVDATGRARQVARLLGSERVTFDRLIGLVGVFLPRTGDGDQDAVMLVEAVSSGWWYATLLPTSHVIVGHMTDADLAAASRARTIDGWTGLLDATSGLRERVGGAAYQLQGPPQVVCADSSCLVHVAGDGWCAVGDAATSYDPLSSRGLTAALQTGLQTAHAMVTGHKHDMRLYEEWVHEQYARYLAEWLGY
jgi:flavin-dependent dehydrogenase